MLLITVDNKKGLISSSQDYNYDSETDDEENPKKKPAAWTQGSRFTMAIERQNKCPPDLDQIFAIQDTIELTEVFPGCSKFSKRTSGDRRTDWDEADAPRSHNHDECKVSNGHIMLNADNLTKDGIYKRWN